MSFASWALIPSVATAFLALATSASAQTHPTYVPAPPPPSHMAVGTQYYEADLDGLRQYLDSIKTREPSVYAALDPKLSSLESLDTTAKIVGWGSIAVAVGLVGYSLQQSSACNDKYEPLDERWDACNDDAFTWLYVGGAVGVAGGIVGFLILPPGRSDFLSFVNEHNRVNPESPMRLNLGYDPNRGHGYATLRLDFDLAGTRHFR